MESIITVKNIGKRYNITHQRGGYVTLRDVLMNVIKSPFSFLKSKAKQVAGMETKEDFWALSNINFTVILRVEKFVDKYLVTHEFIKALKERYEKEGIEISWPVRKIYQAK